MNNWGGVVKSAEGDIPPGSVIEIGPRSYLIRFAGGGIKTWHDSPNSQWRNIPEVLAGDGGIETWRG